MAMNIEVRKAKLQDAEAIADFVNSARPGADVNRLAVAERFSQVGFMLAENEDGALVGLVGFQVENLVIRVKDFLISPADERVAVGRELIAAMEQAGVELQTEASFLFLPPNPSQELIQYWESFGYEHRKISDMHRAWREAAVEWDAEGQEAMVKQLREDLTRKPL